MAKVTYRTLSKRNTSTHQHLADRRGGKIPCMHHQRKENIIKTMCTGPVALLTRSPVADLISFSSVSSFLLAEEGILCGHMGTYIETHICNTTATSLSLSSARRRPSSDETPETSTRWFKTGVEAARKPDVPLTRARALNVFMGTPRHKKTAAE